jgi:cysteine desulfurase / selenocysteine lyase
MLNWASLFGDFDKRLWLNTADQGPMPLCAGIAAIKALEWKIYPGRLSTTEYQAVPVRLRQLLRLLIGATNGQIVLGNSTTYGLSIIARALAWRSEDQVLLVEGDFPANFTPWQGAAQPIQTQLIPSRLWSEDPAGALRASLRRETRIFCASWVDSFTGRVLDLRDLGNICRGNGTFFVVNASQGLGNRCFVAGGLPIDALTCSGSKWLCGPYGTGFCWIGEEMSASMLPIQYYWQANRDERTLSSTSSSGLGADNASYDVFATANFLNYVPWMIAIECLLEAGIESISKHIDAWVLAFKDGFDTTHYEIVSTQGGIERSALIFVNHKEPMRNDSIHQNLRSVGIDVALRRGKIRISPHFFNPLESVSLVLDSLRSARSVM